MNTGEVVNRRPLCVDCDGTLIQTDLLHEAAIALIKSAPLKALAMPVWLLRGKAHLKAKIAGYVSPDVRVLPYNQQVIALVRRARSEGRETALVTASPASYAHAIEGHLGLFDRVEATDGTTNLSGSAKARRLVELYGERGFDYAGNARDDLPVWQAAEEAIVVDAPAGVRAVAARTARVAVMLDRPAAGARPYLLELRPHQWLKNLLVFVPMLAAHQVTEPAALGASLLAFLAFSLCASAVYVLNDLFDLPADRQHARKRNRPLAAGTVPVLHGVLIIPLLLIASAAIALSLPPRFWAVLLGYLAATTLYSFWLKNAVVVDVLLLAALYTSRVIAGAAATSIPPSFWLLALSMFLFLSLAIVKRYSEMLLTQRENKSQAAGRGYLVADLPVLLALGTASGYLAVLVLALYVNSGEVTQHYQSRGLLWLTLPLLLYWISRVWMKAHRGLMHDDPLVFAATDWQSWLSVLLAGGFATLAAYGW